MIRPIIFVICFAFIGLSVLGDGPQDNIPEKVRPVPPVGIEVPNATFAELKKGVVELRNEIDGMRKSLAKSPALLAFLPDVEIFANSVYYALRYNEFYSEKEFEVARKHLQQGRERAKLLREGKTPWNTETGLVVRGYVSKIDGSVQPYGLVVPKTHSPTTAIQHRLDVWFHGRGEKLTELNFIEGRQKDPGQFTPANAFVLHPYGRYCNANHFAGEIDTFEAIEHIRKHYPIDVNRVAVRGFSMGGAACWNFAVHYPGLWAAAAPGAGFSETPEFLRVFQGETIKPNEWEKKLLRWYDCTDWAGNLFNCPTVAYSGENDKQKQAADIMAEAMLRENLQLVHIIGPKTGHSYHPDAKAEINRRIDTILAKGRDPFPRHVKLTTYTLRYNTVRWLTIDSLEQHWEQARVTAEVFERNLSRDAVVHTKNVDAFTLSIPAAPRCSRTNRGRATSARSMANGACFCIRSLKRGCASNMACKARSTMRSWTSSSWSSRPGSPSTTRSASGSKRSTPTPSITGASSSAASSSRSMTQTSMKSGSPARTSSCGATLKATRCSRRSGIGCPSNGTQKTASSRGRRMTQDITCRC